MPASLLCQRGMPRLASVPASAPEHVAPATFWQLLPCSPTLPLPLVCTQEKENAPLRASLLQELASLQADLEAAVEMYSGRAGYEELRRQMGSSLLHSMLQHKRLAQVG